jgi:hypothetical protein
MAMSVDDLRAERVDSTSEDVHFTRACARAIVEEYSALGDVVLDPFAGYGTTLVVSEQLGRISCQRPDRAAIVEGVVCLRDGRRRTVRRSTGCRCWLAS